MKDNILPVSETKTNFQQCNIAEGTQKQMRSKTDQKQNQKEFKTTSNSSKKNSHFKTNSKTRFTYMC